MFKLFKKSKDEGKKKSNNDELKTQMSARRSKSTSDLQRDSGERKRSLSVYSPAVKDEKNVPSRRNILFASQIITKREVDSNTIDDFIAAVKHSCPSSCKIQGNYFYNLNGDNWNILKKVAEKGLFSENIDFLEQFNAYMQGKLTATELYPYLDGLNLDDSEDKRYLTKCDDSNSFDSAQDVKQAYQNIAESIFNFLVYNLHAKRTTIQQVLHQQNQLGN
ncbi:hypothetical protein A8135_02335 [Legionella jamestowniensis]|uniref:Dot/Icm T4SS effector n=1 Tax=Legionella jamestowniensis TaxID=455 RepID=A0ABX2XSU7_9GAMM|nr:hypothetical protein [Legionella jamestowniensis]OCH97697.1 hypothetical protein A8135_02335 [Legionella jamestowniensis]